MKIDAIVLAAGKGKRMNSNLPKPLHKVAGKTLLHWLEETLKKASVSKNIFVLGHDSEKLKPHVQNAEFIIQEPQLGTGHAVKLTKNKFDKPETIIKEFNTESLHDAFVTLTNTKG